MNVFCTGKTVWTGEDGEDVEVADEVEVFEGVLVLGALVG